ncbi:MAG: hypothetical protein AAGM46_28545, partial [Cyanobacteria bacterium J06582_2]
SAQKNKTQRLQKKIYLVGLGSLWGERERERERDGREGGVVCELGEGSCLKIINFKILFSMFSMAVPHAILELLFYFSLLNFIDRKKK